MNKNIVKSRTINNRMNGYLMLFGSVWFYQDAWIWGGTELWGLSLKALRLGFAGLSVQTPYTGDAIVRTGWLAQPVSMPGTSSTVKKEGKKARGVYLSKERAWLQDFPGRFLLDISFLDLLASHFTNTGPELDLALSLEKGGFPRNSNCRSSNSRRQVQL